MYITYFLVFFKFVSLFLSFSFPFLSSSYLSFVLSYLYFSLFSLKKKIFKMFYIFFSKYKYRKPVIFISIVVSFFYPSVYIFLLTFCVSFLYIFRCHVQTICFVLPCSGSLCTAITDVVLYPPPINQSKSLNLYVYIDVKRCFVLALERK